MSRGLSSGGAAAYRRLLAASAGDAGYDELFGEGPFEEAGPPPQSAGLLAVWEPALPRDDGPQPPHHPRRHRELDVQREVNLGQQLDVQREVNLGQQLDVQREVNLRQLDVQHEVNLGQQLDVQREVNLRQLDVQHEVNLRQLDVQREVNLGQSRSYCNISYCSGCL